MTSLDVPVLRVSDFVRPPFACHVSTKAMRRGATPGLHSHDFPEVFWIEGGTAVHAWPDGQDTLGVGHIVFVAAHDVHGFRAADDEGYRLFNVAFPQAHWDDLRQRYGTDIPDVFGAHAPLRARTRQLDRHQQLALAQAASELRRGIKHAAALDRFLLNLLHILAASPAVGPHAAPAWLTRASSRMRDNPDALQEGTGAFVRLCHRSAEHVSRETRRWYGQTPTDLVNEMRLDWAAATLATSDASVVDVVQSCGFSNVSHFYRLFQARFGVTPGAHRHAAASVIAPAARPSRPRRARNQLE